MKSASADLIALFANSNQFVMWDLYTVTLTDGTVLTYTTEDTARGAVFPEAFEDGTLAAYSSSSGNAALFSIVTTENGKALFIASQNNPTYAGIRRSIPRIAATRVSSTFKITSTNSDDSGYFSLQLDTVLKIQFIPMRDAAGDAARRPMLTLGGSPYFVAQAALSIGTWFEMQLTIAPGAGASVCRILDRATGAVVAVTSLSGSHTAPEVNQLEFIADNDTVTGPAFFERVTVGQEIEPIVERGTVRSVIGLEVDTLDVRLRVNSDVRVANVPLAQFARMGGYDAAAVQLDRYFAADHTSAACGSLNLFTGTVADVDPSGTEVRMTVNSAIELLNIKMPRNLYMASCLHTLFDSGCGLAAGTFTFSAAAGANCTTRQITCNLAQAAGYFDLGTIEFTSGFNAGQVRTVKTHTSGVLVPSFPLPYAPASGDLFSAKPGCDKLYATCNSAKFSNSANHRAYPFIPAPELTY
jgi:uncharacterized phage protein (TIGR02218 family)